MGYSPWGRKDLNMTEQLTLSLFIHQSTYVWTLQHGKLKVVSGSRFPETAFRTQVEAATLLV